MADNQDRVKYIKHPGINDRVLRSITNNLPTHQSSVFNLAKAAENHENDYSKAEQLYKKAILTGDKVQSAIKDLASLMHRTGRPLEAIQLLKTYEKQFYYDYQKFQNLLLKIQKSILKKRPTRIKVSGLNPETQETEVRNLFKNPRRIASVWINLERKQECENYFSIIEFHTHSAARKTLESFSSWDYYTVEWISDQGEASRISQYFKVNPIFEAFFSPKGSVFSLPIDRNCSVDCLEEEDNDSLSFLLGRGLFQSINNL